MQQVVAIVVGLLGIVVILFGAGWAIVLAMARCAFERFLKMQLVDLTKAHVSDLLDKVRNPVVRRLLNKHAGEAAGAIVVSLVRSELKSRFRIGLLIMLAGLGVFISAFYVTSWWTSAVKLFTST